VIFVTVGSIHFPFTRLVEAAAALEGEVVMQHGTAPAPPGVAKAEPFMPFRELAEYVSQADVVVTHAGVGSIVLAVEQGHVPVTMPRLRRFGETVDDHQLPLVELLADHGTVIPALEPSSLADAVARVPDRGPPRAPAEREVHRRVRAALQGQSP
jgi:UDP-N-acetylglucosamine transferase subunit ALG13